MDFLTLTQHIDARFTLRPSIAVAASKSDRNPTSQTSRIGLQGCGEGPSLIACMRAFGIFPAAYIYFPPFIGARARVWAYCLLAYTRLLPSTGVHVLVASVRWTNCLRACM